MAIQEQRANDAPTPPTEAMPISSKGAARRRFARASVGVGGVLMTLPTHAAMVCGVVVSTSGYQSLSASCAGLSHAGARNASNAKGKSPTTWGGQSSWSSSTCGSSRFNDIFNSPRCSTSSMHNKYGNLTLQQVCKDTSINDGGLGRYCAAAYMNASSDSAHIGNYLPPSQVVDMFRKCTQGGKSFMPVSNNNAIVWGTAEVVAYLQTTMA